MSICRRCGAAIIFRWCVKKPDGTMVRANKRPFVIHVDGPSCQE